MANFHRTSFRGLLWNILEVTENHDAGFTFPTVASIALQRPDSVYLIRDFHQEVASHGFLHIKYAYLSSEEQKKDIKRSILTLKSLGFLVRGFRAPYNSYTEQTPRILEEHRFIWDGGIGHASQHNTKKDLFRIPIDRHMSSFICIPLNRWSDDLMIDRYGLDSKQISKILKVAIKRIADEHGVIMFDLHPIRIGQPKYVEVLEQILTYGTKLNGWFPRTAEAVEYWLKHHEWKDDASFCCLLTGDIDNFSFADYLRRLF
jgi:peptidoglycan/xylan/chitin deacetylase (PgdA/CDA1 family)